MPSGIEGDMKDMQDFSERLRNCAITVDILKYLNGLAIDLEYNRQIEPSFLDETMDSDLDVVADDRFPCVLLMAMPHYHRAGVETDTHVRLFFEVIVMNRDGSKADKEYTQVTVDVPMEAIEILPNIPEIRWIDEKLDRNSLMNAWKDIDKSKLNDEVISKFEELLSKEREEE